MGFIGGRLFLEVLHHLSVDELDEALLVILKDVLHVVFAGKVGLQMRHHLPGQLVQQFGVVVVAHVVEVDQTTDEVVLQAVFRDAAIPAHQPVP